MVRDLFVPVPRRREKDILIAAYFTLREHGDQVLRDAVRVGTVEEAEPRLQGW